MTITHISERELALERENARLLNAVRLQAAAIEAQRECIAELEAQPVQEPLPHWYTVASDGLVCLCASEDDAIYEAKKADAEYPHRAPRKATRLYLAAAPVQPARAYIAFSENGEHISYWTRSFEDAQTWTGRTNRKCEPFYPAPVQPAPMTDEQI